MADGHFPDVELLRRELAALILEWAGQAVKDDPDGPMSTALTRAVSEAARSAVVEQHQILSEDTADRIAEALERRGRTGGAVLLLAHPWRLGLVAVAAAALLTIAFLLGLQTGRKEGALPQEPAPAGAASAGAAPMAPLAPAVEEPAAEEPAPLSSAPRVASPQPSPRVQSSKPALAKPASQPPPRELGRPATTSDEASTRSTQPVGAAPATVVTPKAPTTP